MANIRLKELLEANVDPKLVARSKKTGKLVYFKSPEAKASAVKAGSHEEPKKDKAAQAKQAKASANMFKGDYAKDRGTKPKKSDDWMDDLDSIDTSDIKGKADPDADSFTHDDVFGATFKDPQTGKTITVGDAYEREDDSPAYQKAFAYVAKFDPDKEIVMGHPEYDKLQNKDSAKSKYDDPSYWKLSKDDYRDSEFSDDDDDSWSDDSQFTADSLDLVDSAINDEFGNEFETTRQSGGGDGGWEGPMQVFAKGADADNAISLSVGSNDQNGKFSIVFLEPGGEEALFEPNWDAMTGDESLTPQQTYKVTKALLKMPEVQKLLKGEIKPKQFGATYAKLKDKFSKGKTESTKLTSMIKK